MDLGLDNATVLVAGGTTGMGRAAAECFAADRARVAVLARSRDALDETARELTRLGAREAIGLQADLFDGASVDAVLKSTSNAMLSAPASSRVSTSRAWMLRGQGHTPTASRLRPSMSTKTTSRAITSITLGFTSRA